MLTNAVGQEGDKLIILLYRNLVFFSKGNPQDWIFPYVKNEILNLKLLWVKISFVLAGSIYNLDIHIDLEY